MTEREMAEGLLCSRPDSASRAHKNLSRNKDKYNGSSCGRRGRMEAPPTFTTPSRHHLPTSRVSNGRQSRERRRLARGKAGDWEKSQPVWEGGSEGERKGRKTSLNHLLNFTLSPREAAGEGARRRRFKTHSYNKEQFLQANCQFVVPGGGDYSIHTSDPDLLVDWDSIELVRLFCHEIPSCPICLYPPRAAKITQCGHVYCWSCVIHYLSLGERKWRKCPICYESIYKKDLKSVMALSTPQHSPGDVVSMRLMVREKDSTLVRPSSQTALTPPSLPSLSEESGRFAKLLQCSVQQSLELIVGPERGALSSQLASLDPEEQSEQCFIEQALEELKARELALLQSKAVREDVVAGVELSPGELPPLPPLALSEGYVEGDCPAPAFSDSDEGERGEEGGDGSPSSSMSDETQATDPGESLGAIMEELVATSPSVETLPPISSTPPDSSLVYFYQSDDGQHLYLHTINARCLVKEYGGLEFAPEIIKARIVEMDQLTMAEEARSHYKYLSHLPITCQFALCELDLRPPVVSQDTLAFYRGELDQRRSKRARKKREEKRKEKAAAATRPSPPSSDAFPLPTQPLSPEKIHDLLPQLTSSPSASRPSPQMSSQSKSGDQDMPDDGSSAHPSFADALRGKPPPVWPIKLSPRQYTPSAIRGGSPCECGGEGEGEKVPSFQEAFTEALLTSQVSTGQSSKKTAKKGRKKLVLFSTGGARGSTH